MLLIAEIQYTIDLPGKNRLWREDVLPGARLLNRQYDPLAMAEERDITTSQFPPRLELLREQLQRTTASQQRGAQSVNCLSQVRVLPGEPL